MGLSTSWLAVQNTSTDDVLKLLGLKKTNCSERAPDFTYCLTEIDAWKFILLDHATILDKHPNWIQKLSAHSEVFYGVIEEHVMFSSLSCFVESRCVWELEHDSSRGIEDISIKGNLPPSICEIVQMQTNKIDPAETEVDYYFDVPLKAAKFICCFDYWSFELFWELRLMGGVEFFFR